MRIAARLAGLLGARRPAADALDPGQFGLVPADQVSVEPLFAPELAAALDAARQGDWRPAADLLADVGRQWDLRGYCVRKLAELAVHRDGWLTEWLAAAPASADPVVVQAEFLVALAWEVRSGKRAEQVTPDRFAAFHRLLAEAERTALAAAELAPRDPTPWASMVAIGRGLHYPNPQFEVLWSEVVSRDPEHREAHEQALQYWCRKWFGSHERMFSFARHAAKKAPTLTPLPLIAALELEIAGQPGAFAAEQVQAEVDIVLRRWLDGAGADDPRAVDDRGLVALALTRGARGAAAVDQFRVLGTRADAAVWRRWDDPVGQFLHTREHACRQARRDAESSGRDPAARGC